MNIRTIALYNILTVKLSSGLFLYLQINFTPSKYIVNKQLGSLLGFTACPTTAIHFPLNL